jgi:hypothetical protein
MFVAPSIYIHVIAKMRAMVVAMALILSAQLAVGLSISHPLQAFDTQDLYGDDETEAMAEIPLHRIRSPDFSKYGWREIATDYEGEVQLKTVALLENHKTTQYIGPIYIGTVSDSPSKKSPHRFMHSQSWFFFFCCAAEAKD